MYLFVFITGLLFGSSFEANGGTIKYFTDGGPLEVIEECQLSFQSISDTTAYTVDYYQFDCNDSINNPVYGTNHKSIVFINNMGIYCDIDLFEYRSKNDFELLLICD